MTPKTTTFPESPNGERGSALLITILVLFVVATLGMSSSHVALSDLEVAANYESSWRAFYAADGLAQASFHELINLSRQLGRFPDAAELSTIAPVAMTDITVADYALVATGPATEGPLTTGYFHGLTALTRPYEVVLRVDTIEQPPATASVTMGSFFDIIPIFQFAVFYENDLELFPGPEMTLLGRVHTNADLYLGAGSSLRINSNVTAAGDAFHRRKDSATRPSGSVGIRDGLGNFPDMDGLDSTDADWVDESLARWNGNIRTSDHGIPRLNLTIADPTNPRKIIEPGYDSDTAADRTAKIFYAAAMNINILNGQGFDPDGNRLDLRDSIDFDIIYDHRQQKEMLVVELDVTKLATVAEFPDPGLPATIYIGSFEPGNGIPDWQIFQPGGGGLVGGIGGLGGALGGGSPLSFAGWLTWLLGQCTLGDSDACDLLALMQSVDTLVTSAVTDCVIPNVAAARTKIDAADGYVDDALAGDLITADEAFALQSWTAPVRDCIVGGVDDPIEGLVEGVPGEIVDWPPRWAGKTPPYDGGNTEFAVKIENGAELANPLTIVTANPVYIQGDYNAIAKQPAAILADAVTILSNAWDDDDEPHSLQNLDDRVANDTIMNVALMLGNTETAPGIYNGGVENLPRFLEDWSGRTFLYRGSLIDLWYSRSASGNWSYGSPVYKAPIRDWQFDTELLDPARIPPATPRVYTVRVSGWRRH